VAPTSDDRSGAPAAARGRADRDGVVDLLRAHHLAGRLIGSAFMFRCRWRSGWTILVAVFAGPIGLIALTQPHTDEVVVALHDAPQGTTELISHGVGPLAVRRVVAGLRD
jgi:hypothetical protein